MAWPRGERSSSAATLAAGSALLLLLLLPELSPTPGVAAVSKADFRSVDGKLFNRTGPISGAELQALRNEAKQMFRHGFDNYMQRAFPRDDLRPISCRGSNSQGGIALSLIDALDTLILLGEQHEVRRAVQWLCANLSLEVDERVHVFELTIRALGGFLSTHVLLLRDPTLVPGYDGCLLVLAQDLAERLLPAFATPSGIPLSWVNLATGVLPGETRATCTACAGTLLLEFGLLSRLSGDPKYEQLAHNAAVKLFRMRSKRTGLLGNTLNVDVGAWVRKDSGIGAGIDSFYEYLLKAWLVFGKTEYLEMFAELYTAAMVHLRPAGIDAKGWLLDVHMDTGKLTRPWVSSLGAFWPGMQAMIGQMKDATSLHDNLTNAWLKFGWLPELFDVSLSSRHPIEKGYPLRPELIESTYLLHAETGEPYFMEVARSLQATLMERNRQRCGFASVRDVQSGELEDSMESFFLSETSKYLYLLHSNASGLLDHFVFSTEGHLIPPFPAAAPPKPQPAPPLECLKLCTSPVEPRGASTDAVRRAFPLLALDESLAVIRPRRCQACIEVSLLLARKFEENPPQRSAHHQRPQSLAEEGRCKDPLDCPEARDESHAASVEDWLQGGPESSVQVLQQVLCGLVWRPDNSLRCGMVSKLLLQAETSLDMEALPPSTVVLQVTAVPVDPPSIWVQLNWQSAVGTEVSEGFEGINASFGPEFERSVAEPGDGAEEEAEGGSEGFHVLQGSLAAAEPPEACGALQNAAAVRGAVALLHRGQCTFLDKVLNAQAAGAIGVLVANVLEENRLVTMGDDGTGAQPDIPAVSITKEAGAKMRDALAAGAAGGAQRPSVELRAVRRGAGAAGAMFMSGTTQVNMMITPPAQQWLFQQSEKKGVELGEALQGLLNDPDTLAALMAVARGESVPASALLGSADEEEEEYEAEGEGGEAGAAGGSRQCVATEGGAGPQGQCALLEGDSAGGEARAEL
eukprot:jgi/Tetstr1/421256/TSEL_012260.t1